MIILTALLKGLLFAPVGFVVIYITLLAARWWPTTYVDTRDLPKGTASRIEFKLALAGAAVGFLVAFLVELFG